MTGAGALKLHLHQYKFDTLCVSELCLSAYCMSHSCSEKKLVKLALNSGRQIRVKQFLLLESGFLYYFIMQAFFTAPCL